MKQSYLFGASSNPVNSPDPSQETPIVSGDSVATDTVAGQPVAGETSTGGLPSAPSESMQEYYQLQQALLRATLIMTTVVFGFVWAFYSLNVALNYLIGACTGVVYLRMLARNVAQLGRERDRIGSARLALLVGLILVASRLNQLQILPIFLGFLTYKVAVIFYMLRTTLLPHES